MTELEKLTREWYQARKDMLSYLSDTESWLKAKGKSMEVDQTTSFNDAWKRLANSEWALTDFIKGNENE